MRLVAGRWSPRTSATRAHCRPCRAVPACASGMSSSSHAPSTRSAGSAARRRPRGGGRRTAATRQPASPAPARPRPPRRAAPRHRPEGRRPRPRGRAPSPAGSGPCAGRWMTGSAPDAGGAAGGARVGPGRTSLRRRVEGHPADPAEQHLRPRVGVGVGHRHRVAADPAAGVPDGYPGRQPQRAGGQHERGGELSDGAAATAHQGFEAAAALPGGGGLVVAERRRAELLLQLHRLLVGRAGLPAHLGRQLAETGWHAGGHRGQRRRGRPAVRRQRSARRALGSATDTVTVYRLMARGEASNSAPES